MGKSNRIRTKRAEVNVNKTLNKKSSKKGTPTWLYSCIAVVVTVVVLAAAVLGVLSSNGVFMRARTAVRTENYKINGNMMSYLFNLEYEEFYNQYSSQISSFSLDTSKSLKSQKFGDTTAGSGYEIYYLGQFDGTWFDYFAMKAEASAKQMLVYCEEANVRGITLNDEDYAQIDTAIEAIKTMASNYGYSTNAYLSSMYGPGVKLGDIRDMMEISSLAAKCASQAEDEIIDAITDEQVAERYNNNKLKYDVVDYVYYTVKVNYDNIPSDMPEGSTEEEMIAEYQKQIIEAKRIINELEVIKDADEFVKAVLKYTASESFDNLYTSENLSDADKLDETKLATVKEKMIAKVIEEVIGAQTSSDDTISENNVYTIYGETITENAAKSLDNVKTKLFESISEDEETYNVKKKNHIENDDASKWLFDDARVAGDVKKDITGDGAESDTDIVKDKGVHTSSVYLLRKAKYKNEELSKNVSYMSFTKKEDAVAAIEAFKNGEKTADAFAAIANDKNAYSKGVLDNYLEGSLSDQKYEAWLYDPATVVGSYTTEPIEITDSNNKTTVYGVFFYSSDGDETWHINAKSDIFTENCDKFYEELAGKFVPTVNAKVIAKIDA